MLAGCAASVHAQSVSDPIQIGGPPAPGRVTVETAIAAAMGVDSAQQRVVAAWFDLGNVDEVLKFAVTFDGWQTPPAVYSVSCTDPHSMCITGCAGWEPLRYPDPMVAASPTNGDLWVGSYMKRTSSLQGFWIARLPNSQQSFNAPVSFQCEPLVDKPLLAVGPSHDTGAERVFMGFSVGTVTTVCNPDYLVEMKVVRSDDQTGELWGAEPARRIQRPNGAICDEIGLAVSPVVVPGGPHAGRLVCSYDPLEFAALLEPARLMYSDDGGANWAGLPPQETPIRFDQYGPPGQTINIITNTIAPGSLDYANNPCAAVDPKSPYTVYVVFVGESADDPGNSDIFVAEGIIDAQGRLTFPPNQITRITDADLGEPVGTQQIMAWGAVDGYHGLNILFYSGTTLDSGDAQLRARYARRMPDGRLTVRSLAPAFTLPPNTFIGHYQMIAASECMVYPCYMSAHTVAGQTEHMRIYVNRINVCSSDSDSDGALHSNDMIAYASLFIANDPRADLTSDSAVNALDLSYFLEGMTCECGTPPLP
jgi:hypothetical protein